MHRLWCIVYMFCLCGVFGIMADEDGSRFKGRLDPVTAGMLGVKTDTTTVDPDDEDDTKDMVSEDSDDDSTTGKKAAVVKPSVPIRQAAAQEAAPRTATRAEDLRSPDLKGRELTSEQMTKYPPTKFIPRSVANHAWGAGENLVFTVDYGFYRAGTATMSVIGVENVNGGLCHHIRTTAESNDFISKVYKVRDRVDSYIDIKGVFSRRFEKRLREGGYKSDEFVDIYQDRLIALSTKQKRAFTEIPLYVQDILSTLYYIRTFDLVAGKNETIEAYADGKVYPLKVIVHKKEKVETPAGTFMCILVEPILKSEGIFRQKGRLLVWMTDDRYKIPVKMTSKVAIGNIAVKLESYRKSVDR